MPTAVTMPQMGESVVEGTVSRWLKAPGDAVQKLEPLLEITTDKIDTELPAPADGTLLQIVVPAGITVQAGTLLAYIGSSDEALPAVDSPAPPPSVERLSGRRFVSPVVGRIAAAEGLDLAQVPGSGLGGRITKKDVLAYAAIRRSAAPAPAHPPAQTAPLAPDEVLQPLTAMRRAIAEHMLHSRKSSAHVTTVFEADMTAVVRHRTEWGASLEAKGIRLTFTPYFIAAAVQGLRAVPLANSRFSEEGIVVSQRLHIGVAVALEDGLIVPVIRDADEKNLYGLARAVNELSDRARNRALSPDDVQGGTFTITNHGVGGSLIGTPIIHQPQAAILGIGAIVKRPVVRSTSSALLPSADDAIVIRPICYLSLSFDHRILDGAAADRFMTVVKGTLENWT